MSRSKGENKPHWLNLKGRTCLLFGSYCCCLRSKSFLTTGSDSLNGKGQDGKWRLRRTLEGEDEKIGNILTLLLEVVIYIIKEICRGRNESVLTEPSNLLKAKPERNNENHFRFSFSWNLEILQTRLLL